MNAALVRWAPAVLLGLGALGTVGVKAQRSLELRVPLAVGIPRELDGFTGRDVACPGRGEGGGLTSYLARTYAPSGAAAGVTPTFSLYVGYYDQQTQGQTIHSPKNCLPGAGWEPLASGTPRVDRRGRTRWS